MAKNEGFFARHCSIWIRRMQIQQTFKWFPSGGEIWITSSPYLFVDGRLIQWCNCTITRRSYNITTWTSLLNWNLRLADLLILSIVLLRDLFKSFSTFWCLSHLLSITRSLLLLRSLPSTSLETSINKHISGTALGIQFHGFIIDIFSKFKIHIKWWNLSKCLGSKALISKSLGSTKPNENEPVLQRSHCIIIRIIIIFKIKLFYQ